MMPNKQTDILFQLIQSLEKAEKRNFKLYIKRNSANSDLKIIQLFDALEKLPEYDEAVLFKKLSSIAKPQLANLKTHLYKQILASLRVLKSDENIELQLNEQLDYARILYNKGLKIQSLKILERIKEIAKTNGKFNFLAQVYSLEKKIETLHITRSIQEKADAIVAESNEVSQRIYIVTRLSNLALKLYGWYIKNGHARNPADEELVKKYFQENMPNYSGVKMEFYELIYLYQSWVWYAFIRQDFLLYYRYSQKWVNLFTAEPAMIAVERGHYIKGLHNLLNAHFDNRNFKKFDEVLAQLRHFSETPIATQHENFRVHTIIYLYSAVINQHLMKGLFQQAITLLPAMEEDMKKFQLIVDPHRLFVFHYKSALMHFGAGNYDICIDYLQKIIQQPVDLRIDLHCYARLLHLMAHFELGNQSILESLIKSVYRFMAKMQNLTVIEEEMFQFIRNSFTIHPSKLPNAFKQFLQTIKQYENNRFQTRSFAYLDVISWTESKVQNTSMAHIIHEKYLASKHR